MVGGSFYRLAGALPRQWGRHWLDELITGTATNVEQIADQEKCSIRQVNMIISLAFLSPHTCQSGQHKAAAAGVPSSL